MKHIFVEIMKHMYIFFIKKNLFIYSAGSNEIISYIDD